MVIACKTVAMVVMDYFIISAQTAAIKQENKAGAIVT